MFNLFAFAISSLLVTNVLSSTLPMMKVKPGSIVALVTPMTKSNAVDYPALTKLLEWHISQGTDGAVILGTTGESTGVSMEERTEIIKLSVKTLKGKMPVIVGTGTIDPIKVVELCQHAKDLGADASLVITPYYGTEYPLSTTLLPFTVFPLCTPSYNSS